MTAITGTDIQDMVEHWLKTPVGAYLGSDYGSDLKALLQSPQSSLAADAVIQKLRTDIPVLQALPPGSINLYGVPSGSDKMNFVFEIAGQAIAFNG